MTDELLREWTAARERRALCALVTVAATRGSVPRDAGAKMLVYADGAASGTIGGGKLESLVVEECLAALRGRDKAPRLKTYPLHENDACSFGAVCGGEATVLIEPQGIGEALYLMGGGHCSRAIAELARACGWHVTVVEDRAELVQDFPASQTLVAAAPEFIAGRDWHADEALVLVSRNYEMDREALCAAVQRGGMGYLGMMGSRRKVRLAFEEIEARGVDRAALKKVHSPLGLDIGADAPAEIAISVMAEVMAALRGRSGAAMKLPARD